MEKIIEIHKINYVNSFCICNRGSPLTCPDRRPSWSWFSLNCVLCDVQLLRDIFFMRFLTYLWRLGKRNVPLSQIHSPAYMGIGSKCACDENAVIYSSLLEFHFQHAQSEANPIPFQCILTVQSDEFSTCKRMLFMYATHTAEGSCLVCVR